MFLGEGSGAHSETRLGTGSRRTRILHAIKKQLSVAAFYTDRLTNFPSHSDPARQTQPWPQPVRRGANHSQICYPAAALDKQKNSPFLAGWV